MSAAPPALVTGAARLPLPYGLFSTFTLRAAGADRWESGVNFETLSCDPAGGVGEWQCDIQKVTLGGVGLTSFTLTFDGQTTASLDDQATAKEVWQALYALSNLDSDNVRVSGSAGGPYMVQLPDGSPTMTGTPTGGTGTVTILADDGAIGLPKDLDSNVGDLAESTPFLVYGHFQCSPVGWSVAKAQEYATAHLLAREEARVEQALWTGDLGNYPSLQDPNTVDLTAGFSPVDFGYGINLLEQFIASSYGSLGVIHMSRGAAAVGLGQYLLDITGGRLMTRLGTPVAAGAGYPGTGPAGEAPATETSWMFATPALFGYRSEVFTSSSTPGDLFDRGSNDLYAVAERAYLLGYDPCGVGAVLVGGIPTIAIDGGNP